MASLRHDAVETTSNQIGRPAELGLLKQYFGASSRPLFSLKEPPPRSPPNPTAQLNINTPEFRATISNLIEILSTSFSQMPVDIKEAVSLQGTVQLAETRLARLESQFAIIEKRVARRATQDERVSWAHFLSSLGARQRDGELSEFQTSCTLDVWQRGLELSPNVMYPTATMTDDGALCLSWTTIDRSLVLEIYSESLSWFFADDTTNDHDGSEADLHYPPARFFSLLRTFERI